MRIAWLSNAPWVQSGYGMQTRLFVPRLVSRLGHVVGIIAFYGLRGNMLDWGPIPVLPAGIDAYGNDVMGAHARWLKADVLISLVDVIAVNPQALRETPWAPWFPVDAASLRPAELPKLRQAIQPIVFSRHAETLCQEAGLAPAYVPHGVETEVFKPMPKAEARAKARLPQDRFIVSMVAANKGKASRKALPESLQAFAQLRKRHPDAYLYLHTSRHGLGLDGLELDAVAASLDLEVGRDLAYADQYHLTVGLYGDEPMRAIYCASDVLLACSHGEGFGVPILEAQSCGVPVITGDWTSMSELTFAGWSVSKEDAEPRWQATMATWGYSPRVEPLAECLEAAYQAAGDPALAERARAGALNYDADRVTDLFWGPVLADLEAKVKSGGRLELVTL